MLRFRLRPWLPAGIRKVQVTNAKTLAQLYHQFQTKQTRFLIAFRHVEVDDPVCMAYMFSRTVPRVARQHKIPLTEPIHSLFMYDRGMSLWAGRWLKQFFAWMGGIPVRRGRRMDLKAIKAAREALINGDFPLTIAPEGATNGHSDILSPLEPGVAQMAFWGIQDLVQQQRSEKMVVLPVSIRYHYPEPDWSQLDRLLGQLETDSGLPVQSLSAPPQASLKDYYQRLLQIGKQMIAQTEHVYRRFYHAPLSEPIGVKQTIPDDSDTPNPESVDPDSTDPDGAETSMTTNEAIAQHLKPLLHEILSIAERYFGISSTGDLPTRCRRIEEAGWNYIYRDDIPDSDSVSPMEKGFADRIATESQLFMDHMRLVESLVAVTGHYVKDQPTFERFAETTLLLFDVMERIKGVKVPRRPRLGWRQAQITIGTPISVTERWSSYAQNRQAGKQAIDTLTADIRTELEHLINNTPTSPKNS